VLGKGSRGSRGSEGTLRRALQPRAGAFEATLRPRDRVRWDPDFQSGEGDLFALTSEGQASRRKPHKRPRASAPGCGCFRDRPRHVGALLRSARFWTWVGAPTFRAVCVPVARTGNAGKRSSVGAPAFMRGEQRFSAAESAARTVSGFSRGLWLFSRPDFALGTWVGALLALTSEGRIYAGGAALQRCGERCTHGFRL